MRNTGTLPIAAGKPPSAAPIVSNSTASPTVPPTFSKPLRWNLSCAVAEPLMSNIATEQHCRVSKSSPGRPNTSP